MKPTLSKIPFWGPLRGPQKGILDSVGFIWEANQPDYLNPRGQRGKPNFAFLSSRFKMAPSASDLLNKLSDMFNGINDVLTELHIV